MDDEALHERIILLDPEAIAAWQDRIAPQLLGWLRRRGVLDTEAEEIWNDVLLATVRAAPGLHPRGASLRRYAYGVARRQQADRYRRPRLDTAVLADDTRAVRPPAPPDPVRIAALRGCLDRASPQHRLIVELMDAGADTAEIAQVLGIAPGSVYQVWRRAKAALRACMEGEMA